MAYCTRDDLVKLLPARELLELTTDSGSEPDLAVIEACISKADAEIDTYLASRYQLPFAAVPAMVQALAVDLAIYHLYSRRSVVPVVRQRNYQQALAFLREVAAGKAELGTAAATRLATGLDLSSAPRLFSRRQLADF
ncbi:MAG: gp436 family protein [Desulfobacca sp.]|uniref:gp436 family protein n=1 Tax=Desulfobacca sp. TaxID=2067990 RepID=UPI00404B631B